MLSRRAGPSRADRGRAGLVAGVALAWLAERARAVGQWLLLMALIATLAWLAMRAARGFSAPALADLVDATLRDGGVR